MAHFQTRHKRDVIAFRLEVPVTVGPGLDFAAEYRPGDWIVVEEQLRFLRDMDFRDWYSPASVDGQRMWDTKYPLVSDADRPALAATAAVIGQRYLFVMKQIGILPCQALRGRVTGLGDVGLAVEHADAQRGILRYETVQYIIPEEKLA